MAAGPRVWKIFCRRGWGGQDYAAAAHDGGFVAIGAEATGPIAAYADRDALVAAFVELYPPAAGDEGRADRAHHLWRFEHDVAAGDWICMPAINGVTYVGVIEDERTYWLPNGDAECEFGHRRRVRWLYDVPTRELQRRLGMNVTGVQTLNELSVSPASLVRAAQELSSGGASVRERHYWAVGADPRRYRIEDAIRERETDLWTTADKEILSGDRLVIWKFAGGVGERGVVALGEVIDAPRPRGDKRNSYWTDPTTMPRP